MHHIFIRCLDIDFRPDIQRRPGFTYKWCLFFSANPSAVLCTDCCSEFDTWCFQFSDFWLSEQQFPNPDDWSRKCRCLSSNCHSNASNWNNSRLWGQHERYFQLLCYNWRCLWDHNLEFQPSSRRYACICRLGLWHSNSLVYRFCEWFVWHSRRLFILWVALVLNYFLNLYILPAFRWLADNSVKWPSWSY